MPAPATPDAVMQARADVRSKRSVLVDAIVIEARARNDLDALLRTTEEDPSDPENPVTLARAVLDGQVQALAAARAAERASRDSLAAAIDAWLKDGTAFVTPAIDVQRLQGGQVIIMFPVRLETRFDPGGSLLRVRVYPDEISLHIHEGALTDDERAAGERFYTGLVLTDLIEERKRWQELVGRFGAPRAAYIARVMRPLMAKDDEFPTNVCDNAWLSEPLPPTPIFPNVPSRPAVWTRPGEAVLPDRWVLVGYRGGRQTLLKTGNPIPEPLALTHDPGGDAATTLDGFTTDKDLLWTIEYATAEQIGMALTISTADDPGVAQGYDRLVVVGVKSSLVPVVVGAVEEPPGLPPPDAAMYLEQLFDGHHYTRGLDIVPQGTPTNNTAGSPTTFPPDDPFGEKSFEFERNPPPFYRTISSHCPSLEADVDLVARGLGVPNGVFRNLLGASEISHSEGDFITDSVEQRRAKLMNEALWPVTWGYFLEQMMDPVFANKLITIDGVARSYFHDHVRGRGPVPAIRVGGVPYGVLPVVSLDLWRPQAATDVDTFEAALVPKLRIFRELWKKEATVHAARVAPGSTDPLTSLVNVLAQQASSRQIRVRNTMGLDTVANLGSFLGMTVMAFLAAMAKRSQALVKAIQEPTWIKARVLGFKVDATSDVFVDPLVTGKNLPPPTLYIQALALASLDQLQNDAVIPGPVKPLLYLLIRQALLVEHCRLARLQGLLALREIELFGFSLFDDRPFFERIQAEFETLKQAARKYLDNLSSLAAALGDVSTEEAERLLTETLDLASHRLDAWITAVATRRLMKMRDAHEQVRSKPVGSYIGGYAWVENLRPLASTATNGGYVHAPSMAQAAAAAVLRSAHQAGGLEAAQKYAVDLSSERVRIGRRILDEVREGQPIGAVLGYRFERALRDKHTDISLRESYIFALRKMFPLVANKSETDGGVPVEKIAARNVVDGLRLRTKHKEKSPTGIPFGTGGLPDPNGTTAERAAVAAITAELDALDSLADAVADLVTAESVYQITRGNVGGAGATLDALARGLRPPDPEIARSPRGGSGVTHRIALAFSPELGEPPGWFTTPAGQPRPERVQRALDLDRFIGRLIGDASKVKATVTYKIGTAPAVTTKVVLGSPDAASKGLRIRPLDLVALARATTHENQGSLLDRYLIDAAVDGQSGVTEATVTYDAAGTEALSFPEALEIARAVGASFAGMRPLRSDDLVPPAESSDAGSSEPAQEAIDLLTSATEARDALDAARAALDSAIQTPGPDRETALRQALKSVSSYDPAAFPDPTVDAATIEIAAIAASAELARRSAAAGVIDTAGSGSGDIARTAVTGFQAVFGRNFLPMMAFTPRNASELALSLGARDSLLVSGDEHAPLQMLEQVARVREPLGRCRLVALYAGAVGAPQPRIEIVQLPFVNDERWVGPRPSAVDPPLAGRTSCLLLVPKGAALDPTTEVSGLVFDEWVEIVPAQREETGVAFHFDNPGAEAPQAVLAAVPAAADGKWTFAQLLATINETLDLAHIRVLEPENLPSGMAQALPAIYVSRHAEKAVPSTEFGNLEKDPNITL